MELLRTYTLGDKKTTEHYFNTYWSKHIESLPKFGFKVKGVWIGNTPEIENQVFALISFPDGADLNSMVEAYMNSTYFAEEMGDFDRSNVTNVDTKIIKVATFI